MLNFMALYWPQGWEKKKRIPWNLGSHFVTLGANVPAFTSNLGPNNKLKLLKVGPKFFQP
jgi:hypothetical protein